MLIRKPSKWLTDSKPGIRDYMTGGAGGCIGHRGSSPSQENCLERQT